ncbi:MAG TPA: AlkA N-terminal domain-containing protein [Candidatus Binatia bacterium]|nr:AlkA N-terminal domain-containing protein [Candidatus Binatia bacterium]
MNLDRDRCYRAMTSHDARFDGRFFIGVRTTGIYCRPVCRVRLPHLKNVTFYPCAAAAEQAGFRACRRCRPEAAPGSAAWMGTSATVARAMRLIDAGALDGASVADLAGRLGVSERHLRRLFDQHVGAAPNQIALTRRLHLARRLLDDSSLSVAEIALASGFGSIRRFNAAMQVAFGDTPSRLRQVATPRRAATAESLRAGAASGTVCDGAGAASRAVCSDRASANVTLRLGYRPPLDWGWMLSFLAARTIAGVEAVADGTYRRAIRIGDVLGRIEVGCDEERRELVASVSVQSSNALGAVSRRLARCFDCHADPQAIAAVLRTDAFLRPLVDHVPGLRLPATWEPFEAAVRAVVGQQVSVAAARTILAKLSARFGASLGEAAVDGIAGAFPTAQELAEADLAGIGMPRSRIETLRSLATAVAAGSLPLTESSDPRETVEMLQTVRGIGRWTAEYVAMRGLADPDALPYGDLGLLRAISTPKSAITAVVLDERSQAWRPWRAYAAIHLWSSTAARRGGGQTAKRQRADAGRRKAA